MGGVSRPPCASRSLHPDSVMDENEKVPLELELTMDADVPLPPSVNQSNLHSLVQFTLDQEGADGRWEVSLLFTSDARIQAMHREFMNLDSPTDIMTFPYEREDFAPSHSSNRGGDVVISVETAAWHAQQANWTLASELLFLTLHGLLHILGWDDEDAGQRAIMLARQSDLLQRWPGYAGVATG